MSILIVGFLVCVQNPPVKIPSVSLVAPVSQGFGLGEGDLDLGDFNMPSNQTLGLDFKNRQEIP